YRFTSDSVLLSRFATPKKNDVIADFCAGSGIVAFHFHALHQAKALESSYTLFEMQTAYAGALLNINTYNQPGVEGGKNATYALLGKSGYEAKKEELNAAPAAKAEYIIG
ncbi:MAG: hypothetical protein IIY09_00740, partial [Clostridia bacterium]|nr:hypothetical protein [Clostridia bacterium]